MALPALAGNWMFVGMDATRKHIYLVNTDSSNVTGGIASFWYSWVNADKRLDYDTVIAYYQANCKTYKYQTKDYSMYRRGKKLRGVSTLSSVFETNEDTMLGSTIKAVCLSKYDDSFIVSIKDPRELGEIGQEAIREINKVNLSK